jgi:hypothetical protein
MQDAIESDYLLDCHGTLDEALAPPGADAKAFPSSLSEKYDFRSNRFTVGCVTLRLTNHLGRLGAHASIGNTPYESNFCFPRQAASDEFHYKN